MPWHEPLWHLLMDAGASLPHALLFSGPEGIGKSTFATALAARLLCEAPDPVAGSNACGECPSCRWFAQDNHPDFRRVIPEADRQDETETAEEGEKKKGSTQIRIDQIRALEDFVYVGGHRGQRRIVVIEPAEAMNPAAANSLLKILEEPPAGICFILITSKIPRLLPTIRSRCRIVKLARPDREAATAWLKGKGAATAARFLPLVGGAPLRALELHEREGLRAIEQAVNSLSGATGEDALELAARWEGLLKGEKGVAGLPMEELVATLQKWVFDLALRKMAGRRHYFAAEGEMPDALAKGAASPLPLLRCYNELIRLRALSNHPLNPRLFLEDMATRYHHAIRTEGR